jgi:hypothetical protein
MLKRQSSLRAKGGAAHPNAPQNITGLIEYGRLRFYVCNIEKLCRIKSGRTQGFLILQCKYQAGLTAYLIVHYKYQAGLTASLILQ